MNDKVAVATDPHFHNYSMFSTKNERSVNSRLQEHIDAMVIPLDFCVENDIKELWILGDLFEVKNRIDVPVYNAVYRMFKEYQDKVNVTLLVGNHDVCLKGREVSSLPLQEVIRIKGRPEIEVIGGVSVCWLPYGYGLGSLDMSSVTTKRKILLGHFGISGAIVRSGYRPREEVKVSDVERYGFDLTLLGHYHKRQFVKDNILYIGSLCAHSFREIEFENGFMVLDMEDLTIDSYDIDAPKFIEVEDVEDIPREGKYYVKLMSKLKKEKPANVLGLIEGRVRSTKERKIRIKRDTSIEEMIEAYVGSQDIGELDKNRLIKMGINITKGEVE